MNRCMIAAGALVSHALIGGPAHAQVGGLSTGTGSEFGLSVAGYRYTESDVLLAGTKLGVEYAGTYAFGDGWFLRGNLRYAEGDVRYTGSGTKSGIPDRYYEVRGLVGKDFPFRGGVLSPYAGLGYRHLYDDLRGTTSTGAVGYRRETEYYTLPIGVGHRMTLDDARLFSTLEYDAFIRGENKTYWSDLTGRNIANFGGVVNSAPDVRHAQHRGYGWRLSSMYEFRNWAVGPYLHYWHIEASDRTYFNATVGGIRTPFLSQEPTNNTQEIGLKGWYRF